MLLWYPAAGSHITLNPNYGAESGGYFFTEMSVPHGHRGLHTTRLSVNIPRGIASARPEALAGWRVNVTHYELEAPYYSHGSLVTLGPERIVYEAETPGAALDDQHSMRIGLQLKLACDFVDEVQDDYQGSASVWQKERTLWFAVRQYSSPPGSLVPAAVHNWTGALKDAGDGSSPAWNPPPGVGVSACPYLFVFPGTRCEATTWMGRRLPPESHPDQRRFEQSVKSIVGESLQTVHEALKEVRATPVLQSDTGGDVGSVRVVAAAALACACASFLTPFALLLCASRASRGKATIVRRHPVEAPT